MAELLRRQSSVYDGRDGCVGGLFSFLDFYQRLHVKKMVGYRRHGRSKLPKSKLSDSSDLKEDEFMDAEGEFMEEGKGEDAKRSGKGSMIAMISKLYKKSDRKKKMSPLASRLLRTISIHHLECNDYVNSEGINSDSDASMTDFDSDETGSSLSSRHVISWPRESVADERYADVAVKGTTEAIDLVAGTNEMGEDVEGLSKELNSFGANNELYLRMLEDPSTFMENYGLLQQCSSPDIVLTKCHSFPRTGSSKRKHSKLKRKGGEEAYMQAANSPSVLLATEDNPQDEESISRSDLHMKTRTAATLEGTKMFSSFELPGSPHKLKDQRDHGTVLNSFKILKEKLKEVIRENDRISMDGVLHKIPYGHKAPETAERENLRLYNGPASENYDTENKRSKLGSDGSVWANNKYSHRSIQRSRSLTESLDKYSHLLESMSQRETRKPAERLKSFQEEARKVPTTKSWGRMLSSPEIRFYDFSNIISSEVSDEPGSPKLPASGPLVSDSAVGIHVSDPKTSRFVYTEETRETEIFPNIHESGMDQQVGSSHIPLKEQESVREAGSHEKLPRPSPISVLDLSCEEAYVSPVKYSLIEDTQPKLEWVTFDELDSPGTYISNEVETVKADLDEVQKPVDHKNHNLLSIQVDQIDEHAFAFVRDILKKYQIEDKDFGEEDFYLSGQVDPLHLGAADSSESMSTDHLILVDLVNEILSDINGRSLSHGPGLSGTGTHIRQKPMGNYLPEVWAKTSWHLGFQRLQNRTFNDILLRDFPKYDGWMNLQLDTGCLGLELEGLILDDLIDEAMLDFW